MRCVIPFLFFFQTIMVLPRRIRPLTSSELKHLTIERLIAYRKQALCLENSLKESDYTDIVDSLDESFIWFKDDPRWAPLYQLILDELNLKQSLNSPE
jgi:hypothetical protein